jgi:hypothetical protein
MPRPRSAITITDKYRFTFVTECSISSSWKNLTDTATLSFPQRIEKEGESIFAGSNPIFKKGDIVKIDLGYYPTIKNVFEGYISKIEPTSPVVIQCEDEAYKLKQESFNLSYKSVTLNKLLTDILGDIEFDAVSADLGAFRITNATAAQVLQELKKVYLMDIFFKGSKLYVGRQYIEELSTEHEIIFERNIIEHQLQYTKEEDIKIKVKAVSMLPNNKKIEVVEGDETGETRTAYFYGLNEKELREAAQREIPKLKFTGYRGGFTTFGAPQIKHGDVVSLKSYKFPERDGKYFVDEVETRFGQSGFRQIVKLGRQAA